MKVLYISSTHAGMHDSSIYYDLMQEFVEKGDDVTVVYAREERLNKETELYTQNNICYLGVKTGNISKNPNLIKKGIATLNIDRLFVRAIRKYLKKETYDLILYSTPPITFIKTLEYFKRTSPEAFIYLMLKDIFPQNAVDIGLMSSRGMLYKMFKKKERKLYTLVDYIGVMSPANQAYILGQEKGLENKVEILPNALKMDLPLTNEGKTYTREYFGIPKDKLVLIYGGNLGLPQAIPFLVQCVDAIKDNDRVFFVVAGSGGQQHLIEDYILREAPQNFKYFGQLALAEYNGLTEVSDVGLIYLDYRFTIPNYPQRLLSYLSAKKPVICATDLATDIGSIAVENDYGFSVPSNDVEQWVTTVNILVENQEKVKEMGQNGYNFLMENYTTNKIYTILNAHVKNKGNL